MGINAGTDQMRPCMMEITRNLVGKAGTIDQAPMALAGVWLCASSKRCFCMGPAHPFCDRAASYALSPPLNLSEPDGVFVDWQIAAISQDPSLCERVVISSPLDLGGKGECDAGTGRLWMVKCYRLSAVDNIEVNASPIDCGTAAALALWMTNVVTPAAEEVLSTTVRKVTHFGTYACRNIAGTPWRSVHARAAAIDVAAFTTSDGSNLTVRSQALAGEGREGKIPSCDC